MNMQGKIFEIVVPKETEVILRKGKILCNEKKMYFSGVCAREHDRDG